MPLPHPQGVRSTDWVTTSLGVAALADDPNTMTTTPRGGPGQQAWTRPVSTTAPPADGRRATLRVALEFPMPRTLARALSAALLLVAAPALACGLDDCQLPQRAHLVDGTAAADSFAWMNHDLAAARHAAGRGDRAGALDTARALDRAMRAQLDALVQSRGVEGADALHGALQVLVLSIDGTPLPVLELPLSDALAAR